MDSTMNPARSCGRPRRRLPGAVLIQLLDGIDIPYRIRRVDPSAAAADRTRSPPAAPSADARSLRRMGRSFRKCALRFREQAHRIHFVADCGLTPAATYERLPNGGCWAGS